VIRNTTIALVASISVQGLGSLLIALRILSTPVVFLNDKRRRNIVDLVLVIVDSGAIYSLTTLSAIITFSQAPLVSVILAAILGQLSVSFLISNFSIYKDL
jgi:hypothetical protein